MMSDGTFDAMMIAFFFLMIFIVFYKPIHTGLFGSLGCLAMGAAAVLSVDNSMYSSVEAVEGCILLFCTGVTLVATHALAMVARVQARHDLPLNCPLRRRTDFGDLDESNGAAMKERC